MKFSPLVLITALISLTGLFAFSAESSVLASQKNDYAWIRGANYVPSYARNDVAIWLDFDPAVIDRELGYAERLKLNTVRVFLQQAVYEKQPEKFTEDLETFLQLCKKHKVQMMPVLFDSCFDPQIVDLKDYREKKWMPSPGFSRLSDHAAMENYIRAIVGKYKNDKRIVMWDVMNEPESTRKYRDRRTDDRLTIQTFVRWALGRVRQEAPSQPLTIGWAASGENIQSIDLVDVICIHDYHPYYELNSFIREAQEWGSIYGKPVIMNEFVGRPHQPIELAIPIAGKQKIGWVFWELMIGKTQFSEGKIPYQGHIYPDGTCFSAEEVAAILYPDGYVGSAETIAAEAGFKVSDRSPKSFTEEGIAFSPYWQRYDGKGPLNDRLWFTSYPNQRACKTVYGKRVVLTVKSGPDCGIASVSIDGKPAHKPEIDTYQKDINWNRRIIVSDGLAEGKHEVVIVAKGDKSDVSSNRYVQIVDILGE